LTAKDDVGEGEGASNRMTGETDEQFITRDEKSLKKFAEGQFMKEPLRKGERVCWRKEGN